ncbi:hypothetical protein BT67DRAFT_434762 [Trichocladium antarcticum]|uniref:Uncharacterized protein n=1 Tax=Trichocladium antarcticum TaxID=1450529 RepID=A0AAN6ZDC3_9PEZI|nr:hypothetical protein BT67DRAFT_434762 [Trichocladium antarcticum]
MKASLISAILMPAAIAYGQWWDGVPDCAYPQEDCFSSHWSSASKWPAPTSYCAASQALSVHSCISSACSATPTAAASYSSLSSFLCANWASCSSAGSTGVYTITAPAFTGTWGPGNHGGNWGGRHSNSDDDDDDDDNDWDWVNDDWDWDHDDDWDDWPHTWAGGVYTVTGCEWNGNPWAGGPGSPWAPWGKGWTWTTVTATVTRVATITDGAGATSLTTSVGLATVAQAVSGDVTSTRSLIAGGQAAETGSPSPSAIAPEAGAAAGTDLAGVRAVAVLLGAVVVVAGLL